MTAKKTDTDLQSETAARWREHPRAEVHVEVPADGGEKAIELHAAGGTVVLNTHGERRLSREEVITLRKKLDMAFQVVA